MELFSDLSLARSTERTEGSINASFVEARARLYPELSACAAEFDGTQALFDGPGSPMTQTFGLGLFEPLDETTLDRVERFFFERGADVYHEVSPLAGAAAFGLLGARGYRVVELTSVLVQSLAGERAEPTLPAGLRVRPAAETDADLWIQTSVTGWGERKELSDHIRNIAQVAFRNARVTSFFVERDGRPIATGALGIHEKTALLAGASTIPEERGKGAQRALLEARLLEARRRGCEVAVMGAEPGSTSQRNAQRNGFQIAYTRVKWHRPLPAHR